MSRLAAALLAVAFASAAQDRADLPQKVDSWYRILQGKTPAGYVHETLRRAPSVWRIEYSRDEEFELVVGGRPVQEEDRTVTALLDESLSPVELSLDAQAGDGASSLTLYAARDERRIEARTPAAPEALAWSAPARDELHLLPALTLYALRQNETLAKPGRVTLRALDPTGKEKAGLEVVIDVGEAVRRTILEKDVTVTPVTFLKPFPAASRATELRDALVDRYGRVVEATMAGGARMLLAAGRDEALAGIGPVHRHGRRDPMDKMTAMRNGALERQKAQRGEADPAMPPPTLDSLASDLVAVRKLLEQVRSLKADRELDEARRTYLRAVLQLKAIRELAAKRRPEMLPEIDEVRDDAELAWDGAAQAEKEARGLYVKLEEMMGRLDSEGVERTHRDLQALRDRIEVERRPEREKIAELAADAGALVVKCRTRRELAAVRLDLTGILMGEKETLETVDLPFGGTSEVRFVRPVAWAEINGQVYRAGDTIAGTRVRIDAISRYGVQVSLRDETRDVGLRR